jgi:two-component system phosphate regulon sensor histidine kinase PhoR
MNKRFILGNILIIFFSLLVLLAGSFASLVYVNNQNNERELRSLLEITCEQFDGSNFEETDTIMRRGAADLRLTFVASDGSVYYDSNVQFDTGNFENHADRPEIINLGTTYKRKSDTIDIQMMYIAAFDDGYYVRLALPLSSIENIVYIFGFTGLSLVIVIMVVTISFMYLLSKKSLHQLNQNLSDLGRLAYGNSDSIKVEKIEDMPLAISSIKDTLKNKIDLINKEKGRTKDVINEVNQGIIVISKDEKIELINNFALNIFKVNEKSVIDEDIGVLFNSKDILNAIEEVVSKRTAKVDELNAEDKVYEVSIKFIDSNWIGYGAIISIFDVTEKKRLEKTKKEFFANASHELKSPLTSIIGFQELITEKIVTGDEAIDYCLKTLKEAKRMNQIIVDMLNLSKFENEPELKVENVNVKSVVNETLTSFMPRIEERSIKVESLLDDLYVSADRNHIEQIVRNLIDNAIKYNKDGGKLILKLGDGELTVSDTGIGIPKEYQDRVFERFFRVDKAKSKEVGGTGLGLAIVKHVAEIYGYEIKLISKVNVGTSISIIFSKES